MADTTSKDVARKRAQNHFAASENTRYDRQTDDRSRTRRHRGQDREAARAPSRQGRRRPTGGARRPSAITHEEVQSTPRCRAIAKPPRSRSSLWAAQNAERDLSAISSPRKPDSLSHGIFEGPIVEALLRMPKIISASWRPVHGAVAPMPNWLLGANGDRSRYRGHGVIERLRLREDRQPLPMHSRSGSGPCGSRQHSRRACAQYRVCQAAAGTPHRGNVAFSGKSKRGCHRGVAGTFQAL